MTNSKSSCCPQCSGFGEWKSGHLPPCSNVMDCKCHSPLQLAEREMTPEESEIAVEIDKYFQEAESVWEKLDAFIRFYCDESAPHLLDNDENDGERLRESIRSEIQKAKAEGIEEGIKIGSAGGVAYTKEKSSATEEFGVIDGNAVIGERESIEQHCRHNGIKHHSISAEGGCNMGCC